MKNFLNFPEPEETPLEEVPDEIQETLHAAKWHRQMAGVLTQYAQLLNTAPKSATKQ